MARKLGLRFTENMYGHYEVFEGPAAGQRRRFDFHWNGRYPDVIGSLHDRRGEGTGWVEAEGLAGRAPIEGFMVFKPFVERFIRYEFQFTADDGHRYWFKGQKEIRHLHPARTWTTLPGEIFDDAGRAWARTLLRFRFREALPFLLSFRTSIS